MTTGMFGLMPLLATWFIQAHVDPLNPLELSPEPPCRLGGLPKLRRPRRHPWRLDSKLIPMWRSHPRPSPQPATGSDGLPRSRANRLAEFRESLIHN